MPAGGMAADERVLASEHGAPPPRPANRGRLRGALREFVGRIAPFAPP